MISEWQVMTELYTNSPFPGRHVSNALARIFDSLPRVNGLTLAKAMLGDG